jgi:hypothetical protein
MSTLITINVCVPYVHIYYWLESELGCHLSERHGNIQSMTQHKIFCVVATFKAWRNMKYIWAVLT